MPVLCYAHISFVPRPAPFLVARRTCTASDEKLVGAWERGYAHICMTSQILNELTVSLSSLSLVLGGAAVGYTRLLANAAIAVSKRHANSVPSSYAVD